MAAAITTRTGDQGETLLRSGARVPKDDLQVTTYGCVDELQSHLGLARALTRDPAVKQALLEIQRDLFRAGAELASVPEELLRLPAADRLGPDDVVRLERRIDEVTAHYGLPGRFVAAGAGADSAAVHVARAVCRRCERKIVAFNRRKPSYGSLIVYFNRLSDLLFVLAWALEVQSVVEAAVRDVLECRGKDGP